MPPCSSALFAALLLAFDAAAASDDAMGGGDADPPRAGGSATITVKSAPSNIQEQKSILGNVRQQVETASDVLQQNSLPSNINGTANAPDKIKIQSLKGNILRYQKLAKPQHKAIRAPASAPAAAATPHIAAKSVPSLSVPPAAAVPQAPDEKPLWDMLSQRRYATVLGQIERLRNDYPRWRPPAQLLTLAREGLLRKRIDSAAGSGDALGLVVLAREHPTAFGCSNAVSAWALADAYTKLQQADQAEATARALLSCPNEGDRLATLYKARDWLPTDHWERLLALEQENTRSVQGEQKFRQLRYDYRLEQMTRASNDKQFEQTAQLFAKLEPEIKARKDAPATLLGAWSHFQLHQYEEAGTLFQRALDWDAGNNDAHFGLALTAYQQQHYEIALQQAQALPADSKGRSELERDILVAQAQQADTVGQHARALELFEAAQQQAPLPRYARLLAAWDRVELGRLASAADQFIALYQEEPDKDSAQGILTTLTRSKRDDDLQRLAQSEPLLGLVRRYRADQAFANKQFLTAHTLDPEHYGTAGAVGARQLTVFTANRAKSGSDGTSRLDMQWEPAIEAALPAGANSELHLSMARLSLDSGNLPAQAQVGSFPAGAPAYSFSTQTRLQGWLPELNWHVERDGTFDFALGATPDGGAVAATWTGHIAYQQNFGDTHLEASAARTPVRETLLSYAGLRDPYGGTSWGRVTRNGLQAVTRTRLSERWAVNTQVLAEALYGEQVADNRHLGAELGVAYALPLANFDYAVVGADAGFDRYSKNLSHFTLGHGGYFSPQHFWRAGPFLDVRTAENRRWIVHARLSAGRSGKQEDAAPFFPLNPDGRNYDASSGTGNAFDIELGGVWQLGEWMQFGLQLTKRHSPQYDDLSTIAFLRFLFERRRSVLSSDLPGATAAQLY